MTYFDVIYLLSVFEFSESCQWLQSWSLHFFPNRDLRLPLIVYFHRWSFKKNIKHFKTPNKISRTVNILCYWLPCSPCLFLLWKTNSLMSDKRARTHDFHPKSECRNTFCNSSLSHLTIFNNSSILEHSESKKLTVNSNGFFFQIENVSRAPNMQYMVEWAAVLLSEVPPFWFNLEIQLRPLVTTATKVTNHFVSDKLLFNETLPFWWEMICDLKFKNIPCFFRATLTFLERSKFWTPKPIWVHFCEEIFEVCIHVWIDPVC